jgi:hypothetical protein
MSGQIRIMHQPDPKRPEAPDGIISVVVNGMPIRMPLKGHDKVITASKVHFDIRDEQSVANQEI